MTPLESYSEVFIELLQDLVSRLSLSSIQLKYAVEMTSAVSKDPIMKRSLLDQVAFISKMVMKLTKLLSAETSLPLFLVNLKKYMLLEIMQTASLDLEIIDQGIISQK